MDTAPPFSRLPPEILWIIFRFATDMEGTLDFSPLDPLSDEDRSYTYKHNTLLHLRRNDRWCRYNDHMATSTSLALVCKQWTSLASTPIYQCVAICHETGLSKLCATFDHYLEEASGSSDFTMPWEITQRLNLEWIPVRSRDGYHHYHWDDYSCILCTFKAIKILSVMRRPHHIVPFITDTKDIDGQSLQQVNWNAESDRSLNMFFELAPWIKNIQALTLEIDFRPPYIVGDWNLEFAQLHTLRMTGSPISHLLDATTGWKLPLLSRLYIRDRSVVQASDQCYSLFFKSHGSSLLFVDLDAKFPFAEVITLCPILQHFILPENTFLRVHRLVSHSHISRITATALTSALDWGSPSLLKPALPLLLSEILRSRPVSLKSIRLLSWSNEEYTPWGDQKSVSSWCSIVASYCDAGIRLEDGNGEIITILEYLSNRSS
jgi:hypothetical protein